VKMFVMEDASNTVQILVECAMKGIWFVQLTVCDGEEQKKWVAR